MALIITAATIFGVYVARSADSHLAGIRLANAFIEDFEAGKTGESRYSIVIRADTEPLNKDDSAISVFELSAGPLHFDIALYDECQLRPARNAVADSLDDFDISDGAITVFVDPLEDELFEECQDWLDQPDMIEFADPAWVLMPIPESHSAAG